MKLRAKGMMFLGSRGCCRIRETAGGKAGREGREGSACSWLDIADTQRDGNLDSDSKGSIGIANETGMKKDAPGHKPLHATQVGSCANSPSPPLPLWYLDPCKLQWKLLSTHLTQYISTVLQRRQYSILHVGSICNRRGINTNCHVFCTPDCRHMAESLYKEDLSRKVAGLSLFRSGAKVYTCTETAAPAFSHFATTSREV